MSTRAIRFLEQKKIPFGPSQKLQVVMEESILKFEEILINAGQRGTMLIIAPEIVRKVLECGVGSLVQE